MIFTRASHTLLLAGGILLVAALVADERGALDTVAEDAGSLTAEVEDRQLTERPAQGVATEADYDEQPEGWNDDLVIDDAEFFDQDSPAPVTPDNIGDEVFDPSSEALEPAPAAEDDW